MEDEGLRKRIIEALGRCGPCSFEDLLEALGGGVDLWRLRRILADMVRRGEIVKEPSQERRKLLYRLASGDLP